MGTLMLTGILKDKSLNTVKYRPAATQRLNKHVPAQRFWINSPLLGKSTTIRNNEYAGNNRITSVSVQLSVNTKIEEAVFSTDRLEFI
jgi:hypothetical protein